MKYSGIDIGSRNIKFAILEGDAPPLFMMEETGYNPLAVCKRLLENTKPDSVVATGYGRHLLEKETNIVTITEIKAVARGAVRLFPTCRTIIDIGGQDTKIVELDANGNVQNFEMNDRCAAGTGKFLEIMAHALGYIVAEFGEKCSVSESLAINSLCAVFAESEVIGLITKGVRREIIATAIHNSILNRIVPLVKRVGVREDIVFAGGCALNSYLRNILAERLQTRIIADDHSPFLSALGAAMFARQSSRS